MNVRQRLQELGAARVPEPRPLVSERRIDFEAGCVDDLLRLVGVDRADRVDDRAARAHALRGGAEELELELGERLCAPAQVRSAVEDAEAGARSVDERAVEASELGRELAAVGDDDANVSSRRAARRSPRARVRALR